MNAQQRTDTEKLVQWLRTMEQEYKALLETWRATLSAPLSNSQLRGLLSTIGEIEKYASTWGHWATNLEKLLAKERGEVSE
jgi:hypothetical protein